MVADGNCEVVELLEKYDDSNVRKLVKRLNELERLLGTHEAIVEHAARDENLYKKYVELCGEVGIEPLKKDQLKSLDLRVKEAKTPDQLIAVLKLFELTKRVKSFREFVVINKLQKLTEKEIRENFEEISKKIGRFVFF